MQSFVPHGSGPQPGLKVWMRESERKHDGFLSCALVGVSGANLFCFLPLDETGCEPRLERGRLTGASLHEGLSFVGFQKDGV